MRVEVGREQPHNPLAEKAVIGISLIRGEIPPDLAELRERDFYDLHAARVWVVLRELHAAGKALDALTVNSELGRRGELASLPGREGFVLDCAGAVPTAEHARHYANIIMELSGRRQVIKACAESMAAAYGDSTREALLGQLRNDLADIENAGAGDGPIRVGDAMGGVIAAIEERGRNPDRHFVRTGISRFDNLFGGLRPGKLIVVAAPPSLGKSAWAGMVAVHNAKQGIPALIISLEMTRDELIERFLAAEARIPNQEISSGRIAQDPQRFKQLFAGAQKLAPDDVPLYVDDRESLTTSQLVGTVRRWYAKQVGPVPPKDEPPHRAVVLADYLGLIAPDEERESESRNQQIGVMTRAFKRLAKSLRIPFVLLCQLNREWSRQGGSRPTLQMLRDSGAIEQDADTVLFIWREPKTNDAGQMVIDSQSGAAELIVGKNRGGMTGTIAMHWESQYTNFYDYAG